MRAKLIMLVVAALLGAVLMIPSAASAQAQASTVDLTGQATCVACTVEMVGFTDVDGTLNAVLEVSNQATGQTQRAVQPIAVQQEETCTILEATATPIDLFVLGIRVHVDAIHVLITAERGSLLGDLLCGLFFTSGEPDAQDQLVAPLNEALQQGAAMALPPA
jgi:3-dehydroquinate synthase class II